MNDKVKMTAVVGLVLGAVFLSSNAASFNCITGSCTASGDYPGAVTVESNISFDFKENIVQNGQSQNDLQQWPRACGDDPNEYLIREHASSGSLGDEFNPSLTRNNIYVCADRPSDCAYNGNVYSEGQLANVSTASSVEERGEPVNDPEVCLDLDPSRPGGEWYDMDNGYLADYRVGTVIDSGQWSNLSAFSDPRYWGVNPGTDVNLNQEGYFNDSGFQQESMGSLKPTGYATEDDCQSERGDTLKACDDRGQYERPQDTSVSSWFNAGNFSYRPGNADKQEGARQDNYDTGLGFKGVHNKMQDSSNQFEPGAETQENWTQVLGAGYRVYETKDSTPGPDNWSLTQDLQVSVSNTGKAYPPGQCYYRSGVTPRDETNDTYLLKYDKIFGNSYAYTRDVDGDGVVEGVWEDPDDLAPGGHSPNVSTASFSCDLTGPDKGYGWNTDSGNPEDWYYKNTGTKTYSNSKVVIGNIAFAVNDGSSHGWEQEPNVCGDDNKEYLLEEQGNIDNSLTTTGTWACGTTTTDCVSRNDGDNNAIYSHMEYVNTGEPTEDYGRYKKDEEVCYLQSYDQYGTWYDQDFSEKFCRENTLYGERGVRWIDTSYINNHPYAVVEGVDDDANKLAVKRGNATINSTLGVVTSNYDHPNITPVPTGFNVSAVTYRNKTVTKGFCGGDDGSEYITTQDCVTGLCETDNSVVGVANRPGSCILDGARYPEVSSDKRKLYDPGDQIKFDLGATTKTVSCFGGAWYEKWPIVFRKNKVEVPLGTTRLAQFKLINVESEEKTFNVKLQDDGLTPWNNAWSYFSHKEATRSDTFTVNLEPESSKTYTVKLYGGNTNVDSIDLTVRAESEDGTLNGEDSFKVDVTSEPSVTQSSTDTGEGVPGIGLAQIIVMMMLASTIQFFAARP
ncbi:MAG: hypothetical protein ABEK00_02100 [Candidatus Nanohaloarchaea archaeon]